MKTVVGIDNGTQSTKVIFYDYQNQEILAEASAPHDLITLSSEGRDDGTREQDARAASGLHDNRVAGRADGYRLALLDHSSRCRQSQTPGDINIERQ